MDGTHWRTLGHWATGLRQVLDQTAEFKEDSGIYDALGCQAGHVFPRVGHFGHRCAVEDPPGGSTRRIPQEVFPRLHNSGRGEAGHSLHALFGMVCSRILDWIVDRCGSCGNKWHCCGGFCWESWEICEQACCIL